MSSSSAPAFSRAVFSFVLMRKVDGRHPWRCSLECSSFSLQRVRAVVWRTCAGSPLIWCPHFGNPGLKYVVHIKEYASWDTIAGWSRFVESLPHGESITNQLSDHFRIKTPLACFWRWTNFVLARKRNCTWFFVMMTDFNFFFVL